MPPSPIKHYVRARYLDRDFKAFMLRANVDIDYVNDEGQSRESVYAFNELKGWVS